ncbi:Origin recognition complex subunit 2, variant 2 [Bonamia ostreae]|uniref:Origin recognition complex subunit 2 n=1 Tax=Bonamia ostreae TaxID=126728 RepID=A0ABV2AQJ6_9EUKA
MIDTEKWRVHIECGYNILLFGIGSKKSILLKLLKTADFNDFHRFFVDLNSPKLNLFKILEEIYSKISKTSDLGNRKKIAKKANLKIKGKGVISICKDLKKIMKQSKTKVLLILNSLDNANCDFKNILALSRMASFESVRVIASCETFNIEPFRKHVIIVNTNPKFKK